jgi:adenosylcobinamide-phosphate synthase
MFAGSMLVALAVEGALGWPDALYRRIGHPVTWAGALIRRADLRLNRESDPFWLRRALGVLVCLGITAVAWGLAAVVVAVLPNGVFGAVLTGVLAWPLVATRSLYDHVARVMRPLAQGDLAEARNAVAMIVGRDPMTLDSAGVARAGLESLGESASDGVVAPVFWGLVFGLPGIAAYKAINTMDSMIGHLSPRHSAFGWAAARLDDVVNLIPARLTALLFVIAAGRTWRRALAVTWADASHHRSPNAGWPEAALAGALDIRLSGPRVYDGEVTVEPWVNPTGRDPSAIEMQQGLRLFVLAMLALCGVLVGAAL